MVPPITPPAISPLSLPVELLDGAGVDTEMPCIGDGDAVLLLLDIGGVVLVENVLVENAPEKRFQLWHLPFFLLFFFTYPQIYSSFMYLA